MQLVELQRILPELERAGYAVFALSYDPVEVLAAFAERNAISYTLFADEGSRVIEELGVLDRDLVAHHDAMGVKTREDQFGIVFPVTFVLDAQGRVERKIVEQNYRLRDGGLQLLERLTGVALPAEGVVLEARSPVVDVAVQLDDPTYYPYQRQRLHVTLAIADGWHVYGPVVPDGYTPLRVSVASDPLGAAIAPIDWPSTTPITVVGLDERFEAYDGRIGLVTPFEIITPRGTGDVRIDVRVEFQACSDVECMPPRSIEVSTVAPERAVP